MRGRDPRRGGLCSACGVSQKQADGSPGTGWRREEAPLSTIGERSFTDQASDKVFPNSVGLTQERKHGFVR